MTSKKKTPKPKTKQQPFLCNTLDCRLAVRENGDGRLWIIAPKEGALMKCATATRLVAWLNDWLKENP